MVYYNLAAAASTLPLLFFASPHLCGSFQKSHDTADYELATIEGKSEGSIEREREVVVSYTRFQCAEVADQKRLSSSIFLNCGSKDAAFPTGGF
jgi:hypothetical protein